MRRLAKFWSLTRCEKQSLCEASILLSLSNACVRAIAFKHIDKFLRTRWNDVQGGIDREQEIRLVQRSILRAANVLPWKSLCLCRSIAEYIMLRRRGIPAVMFIGARFFDYSSLDAHAWVETGLAVNDKNSGSSTFTTVMMIGTRAVDR
jgi:transglutaminase superfamily protein